MSTSFYLSAAVVMCLPAAAGNSTTFYGNVLPILEKHCLACHARSGTAPMSLGTYKEARPWAAAIRESVKLRRMPPWFADAKHGEFANDPRLTDEEIHIIDEWVRSGARAGTRLPRSVPRRQPEGTPDLMITAPRAIAIGANKVIDYQYLVLTLPIADDRWVRAAEIRPSDRSVVHHAVLYVREPGSTWLREATAGVPYVPKGGVDLTESRNTKADILAIYTPGAPAMICPDGSAKKIPAGSDLVLQIHYTSRKTNSSDQPQIGLTFAKQKPRQRLLTLQMGRDDLRIPPGEANYRATVTGTLPNDAQLISLFPHMHLRGSAFEYELIGPGGRVETLLKVKPYRFDWQLNYVLKKPRLLPKGSVLRWTGHFDNSANNPYNPDPNAEVSWGEQSWQEMMIGFFDVAVDADVDKKSFFMR